MRWLNKTAFALLLGFAVRHSSGQGLTFRDIAFIGAGGGGGGGGGTTGGGGTSPGAPTEYWDFQEASGTRTGEVLGTALAPTSGPIGSASGLYGNAAQWSSSDDLGAVMPAFTGGNSLSINYWMKWVTSAGNYMPTVEFDTGTGFSDYLYFQWQPADTVDLYTTGPGHVATTYTPSAGTWLMVTIIFSGVSSKPSLYLDGAFIGESASTDVLGSKAAPEIVISGESAQETAQIDEMAVFYNYVLTADNVTWLYHGGAGRQYSDF